MMSRGVMSRGVMSRGVIAVCCHSSSACLISCLCNMCQGAADTTYLDISVSFVGRLQDGCHLPLSFASLELLSGLEQAVRNLLTEAST